MSTRVRLHHEGRINLDSGHSPTLGCLRIKRVAETIQMSRMVAFMTLEARSTRPTLLMLSHWLVPHLAPLRRQIQRDDVWCLKVKSHHRRDWRFGQMAWRRRASASGP